MVAVQCTTVTIDGIPTKKCRKTQQKMGEPAASIQKLEVVDMPDEADDELHPSPEYRQASSSEENGGAMMYTIHCATTLINGVPIKTCKKQMEHFPSPVAQLVDDYNDADNPDEDAYDYYGEYSEQEDDEDEQGWHGEHKNKGGYYHAWEADWTDADNLEDDEEEETPCEGRYVMKSIHCDGKDCKKRFTKTCIIDTADTADSGVDPRLDEWRKTHDPDYVHEDADMMGDPDLDAWLKAHDPDYVEEVVAIEAVGDPDVVAWEAAQGVARMMLADQPAVEGEMARRHADHHSAAQTNNKQVLLHLLAFTAAMFLTTII